MRCTLRISQRGIFVDGDPMSRADAVAHCKHTAGAMVVFDDSATQRSDKTGNAIIVLNPSTTAAEWDATRSALQREGVRIYIRGPLCYGLSPDSCGPTAKPETTREGRFRVHAVDEPIESTRAPIAPTASAPPSE